MGLLNRNAIFGLIAGFALSNIIFSTHITTVDDFDQPAPTIHAATSQSTSPHGTDTNGAIKVSSSVCDHLNGLSTLNIWNDHINTIFQASRHSNDDKYAWHDFTAMLLKEITPRLPQSVKFLPFRQQDQVGNILDVVFQRYQYVKHHQSSNITINAIDPPRKVHILVAGGSVPRGMNCPEYPIDDGTHAHIFCAWPRRLKNLINT